MRVILKNEEDAARVAAEYEYLGWKVRRNGLEVTVLGPSKKKRTKKEDDKKPQQERRRFGERERKS